VDGRGYSFNENGFAAFTVLKDNERITNIQLKVPGIHNISNVLASIAACYALGCSIENIKKGLESYTGIHRRFELKGIETISRLWMIMRIILQKSKQH